MQDRVCFEGFKEYIAPDVKAKLQEKFIVPPFSVLDTRQGYWQERKRLWMALGIQSEIGRGGEAVTYQIGNKAAWQDGVDLRERRTIEANSINPRETERFKAGETVTDTVARIASVGTGTSIFDPVLCELIYKWFCPVGGHIFDPFAGGSVRGVVGSILGHQYTGMDLSLVQIEANQKQAEEIVPDNKPEWIIGDSWTLDLFLPRGKHYDLIFSCPPYHDLEQYTDDPVDLSNMSWATFKARYKAIIEKCILRLNNNRFACFVVSEIRDKVGAYKGLVPFTIQCFEQGGARYYNEMILVNVVGSLPVRIAGQFANRKIGRTHQNILVFYKGDMDLIPKFFKDIDSSFSYGGNNGE